jgi:PhnB protein
MSMQVQPYLFFSGNCEEALKFYQKVLGAKVEEIFRYKESPEPPPADKVPANWGDKIMHASVRIGESQLLASDGCPQEGAGFKNFSLTISATNEAEADRLFNGLAEGGQVQMPLGKTFFSPRFGMLTDRFGLGWMVGVFDQSAHTAA